MREPRSAQTREQMANKANQISQENRKNQENQVKPNFMPMIGLIPLYDEQKESYWMLPGYMKGIEAAGGIPVMLPLTEEERVIARLVDALDGFLLTGGHDVDPALYGEEKRKECGMLCEERDKMEACLLRYALAADKPVFGICRGLQYLNAYLGGTLYQDLPSQKREAVKHQMEPPYDRACHEVKIAQNSWLHEVLGVDALPVNSYHHQAIKDLAPDLEAMAYAPDGLVEAVRMPAQRFVVATQWHPEFLHRADENSRKLFGAFVAACQAIPDAVL